MGLRRGPGQERYLNAMEDIFEEAEEDGAAMPRQWAVHDAATGRDGRVHDDKRRHPAADGRGLVGPYYLWKLLIDVDQFQGKRLRRGDDRRASRLPAHPTRRRRPVHQLRRRSRVPTRLLPALRVRGHGKGDVGRERAGARPHVIWDHHGSSAVWLQVRDHESIAEIQLIELHQVGVAGVPGPGCEGGCVARARRRFRPPPPGAARTRRSRREQPPRGRRMGGARRPRRSRRGSRAELDHADPG